MRKLQIPVTGTALGCDRDLDQPKIAAHSEKSVFMRLLDAEFRENPSLHVTYCGMWVGHSHSNQVTTCNPRCWAGWMPISHALAASVTAREAFWTRDFRSEEA